MKHLHLLVPGLFPPQDIAAEVCAGLKLPALEKMLARATAAAAAPALLEDWLCDAFGASGVAPVRAAADGLLTGEAYWLCADPVSLHLQHAQMLVLPEVVPSAAEAAAFCAELNKHFDGMGMRFWAAHPKRWYVSLPEAPQIVTKPLRQVAWRDAKFFQPQGEGALRWQRILTEVQMLLYAHPANRLREARGVPVINSLWLWGGARAMPLSPAFEAVGGDSELAIAFAQATSMRQAGAMPEMLNIGHESALWVCAAPGEAMQRGDLHAWRETVQQIERDCAAPLLKALLSGRLQRLTLEMLGENGSRRFDLTRRDVWKLWRGPRPLSRYAV